jgi:hypothetical protein
MVSDITSCLTGTNKEISVIAIINWHAVPIKNNKQVQICFCMLDIFFIGPLFLCYYYYRVLPFTASALISYVDLCFAPMIFLAFMSFAQFSTVKRDLPLHE